MSLAEQIEEPTPEDMDAEALRPGTELLGGQYTILRYLGGGGFGITYLARDSLERTVVIKECFPEALCSRKNRTVMTRSHSQAQEFHSLVQMFMREARSVAKLKHPNIVGVHQVFEDNRTAYMALDLVEGADLLDKIEQGDESLTPPVIKGLLRTLLDAVGLVHAQDMLHRDISPDNILLNASNEPVLIDFGAAREEASKKSRAISALLVVKEGYSPQEFYIAGSKQGPFSDLYSLAATFYHVITGTAPPNSQQRLAALANSRPDPYQPLAGQFPAYEPEFLVALDKAMNVFPDDRIQSAEEWILLIDREARQRLEQSDAKETAQVQQMISQLVVEVAQSITEEPKDTRPAPKSEARKPTRPVSKGVAPKVRSRRLEPTAAPTCKESSSLSAMMKQRTLTQRLPSKVQALDRAQPAVQLTAAPTNSPRRKLPQRKRDLARRPSPFQQVRMRLGAWMIAAAVIFNISQSPQHNVATIAAPQIRELIEIGRGLSVDVSQWSSGILQSRAG